jgi:dTDP-4-amino-4,6-dideoxygalactose transaminase
MKYKGATRNLALLMKTTSIIPIAHPLLGAEEQEAVLQVLVSGHLAQGEHVAAFEKRFAELCQVRDASHFILLRST